MLHVLLPVLPVLAVLGAELFVTMVTVVTVTVTIVTVVTNAIVSSYHPSGADTAVWSVSCLNHVLKFSKVEASDPVAVVWSFGCHAVSSYFRVPLLYTSPRCYTSSNNWTSRGA